MSDIRSDRTNDGFARNQLRSAPLSLDEQYQYGSSSSRPADFADLYPSIGTAASEATQRNLQTPVFNREFAPFREGPSPSAAQGVGTNTGKLPDYLLNLGEKEDTWQRQRAFANEPQEYQELLKRLGVVDQTYPEGTKSPISGRTAGYY